MTELPARQRYSTIEILCHDIPVHKRKKKKTLGFVVSQKQGLLIVKSISFTIQFFFSPGFVKQIRANLDIMLTPTTKQSEDVGEEDKLNFSICKSTGTFEENLIKGG